MPTLMRRAMLAFAADPTRTATSVATEVGCSRTLATKAYRALGLDRDPAPGASNRHRDGYNTFREQIWDADETHSPAQVAEEIGCSEMYVRRVRRVQMEDNRRLRAAERQTQRRNEVRRERQREREARRRRSPLPLEHPSWVCVSPSCENESCLHWFSPPRNLLDCDCETCIYLRQHQSRQPVRERVREAAIDGLRDMPVARVDEDVRPEPMVRPRARRPRTLDEEFIRANVVTVAGQQQVSRQLLAQGESMLSAMDRAVFNELSDSYHAHVDRAVLGRIDEMTATVVDSSAPLSPRPSVRDYGNADARLEMRFDAAEMNRAITEAQGDVNRIIMDHAAYTARELARTSPNVLRERLGLAPLPEGEETI